MERLSSAHELATEFYLLNEYLRADTRDVPVAQRMVALAVSAVPGCVWAGVTAWSERSKPTTLGSSSQVTEQVDEIHQQLGEGPCLTAARDSDLEPIRIDDLTSEERWAEFCALVVRQTPVRSLFAFHLNGATAGRCALTLYGERLHAFTGEAMGVGALFAAHARALMLHSASADQVANLKEALTSSRQIGIAVGIVMAIHKVSPDAAFDRLSRASQDLNRKLRDIADDVARTGLLPGQS